MCCRCIMPNLLFDEHSVVSFIQLSNVLLLWTPGTHIIFSAESGILFFAHQIPLTYILAEGLRGQYVSPL